MMKLPLSCLAVLALFHSASAFPNGAGRCVVGEPAPENRHSPNPPGVGVDLASGNYVVQVNGNTVSTGNTITVPPETDFEITVSGGTFRGFLIMLANEPEGSLRSNSPDSQQATGTDCPGTASITHSSATERQSVSVIGSLDAGTATTIEVNIVVEFGGGTSIYHYDQFSIETAAPVLPTEVPETESPTGSPTEEPVEETEAPTASPPETSAPTGTPTEAPVVETETPTGTPETESPTDIPPPGAPEEETSSPTASPVEETGTPPVTPGPFIPPIITNYIAIIEPIPGVSTSVSGTAVVSTIGDTGTVFYGGFISGLQPDLLGSGPECQAVNGCGLHIHSGFGCADNDAQEGHYFVDPVVEDPWVEARYTSDMNGNAVHGAILDIGTDDVIGRAMLVHAQDGSRIGCGLLVPAQSVAGVGELETITMPLASGLPNYPNVESAVSVITGIPDDGEPSERLCYAGYSAGLMPNVLSFQQGGEDCSAANGCGTHIHAGMTCEPDGQLGHWYNADVLEIDPWLLLGYETTDASGSAFFGYCTETGFPSSDAEGLAFIVHGEDGSRVSCSVLEAVPVPETLPVPGTEAPETSVPGGGTDGPVTLPETSPPVPAPLPTIADLVIATPELSTLAGLLTPDLVAALSGNGPFTVFAPVNDAFAKLTVELNDEQALVNVLTYHVVPDTFTSSDLAGMDFITALNGDVLAVTSLNPVTINDSVVIAANIEASNGVVHLIDTVLIPPESAPEPPAAESCDGCPPLMVKGNNRHPSRHWPLGLCEGDCDSDHDCAGDLVCFDSDTAETVPGCSGIRPESPRFKNKVDYCYKPTGSH